MRLLALICVLVAFLAAGCGGGYGGGDKPVSGTTTSPGPY